MLKSKASHRALTVMVKKMMIDYLNHWIAIMQTSVAGCPLFVILLVADIGILGSFIWPTFTGTHNAYRHSRSLPRDPDVITLDDWADVMTEFAFAGTQNIRRQESSPESESRAQRYREESVNVGIKKLRWR